MAIFKINSSDLERLDETQIRLLFERRFKSLLVEQLKTFDHNASPKLAKVLTEIIGSRK